MLGLLKKEEELEKEEEEEEEERGRRMPIRYFFSSRSEYGNLHYIAMLYTHSIGNQR